MINKLPTGWKIVTIDDVFDVIRGISFPKSARTEESEHYVGCLRTANVQRTIEWDDLWKVPSSYLPSKEKLVQENDIIISTANSLNLLGKSAMVKNVPMPSTFGTFVVNLRARLDDPKYLYYYLQSRMFMEQVAEQASTTTNISNISTTKLKRLLVPIPEFSEQKRIVARIEELFSELDSGVETLRKTKQSLAVYRQAVLKNVFDGAVGCGMGTIQSVCSDIVDCPHSTPKWTSEGKICLRTTNFKRGYLDLSEKNYVSDETFDKRNARLVPMPGDVLYSREGAILGIACIIPDDLFVCLGQRMMLLRTNEKMLGRFLMHYLNSPKVTSFVTTKIGGSASPHVNVGDIKNFIVPIPSVQEQEKMLEQIESRLSVCESIEKTVDTALQQAEAMRQSILKKAFEGNHITK